MNLKKVPGGPSGGPEASVALLKQLVLLVQTGFNKAACITLRIVGLKPTYVSFKIWFSCIASSLDQIGPLTKDVEDCANLLQVISGYDEFDSTSIKSEVLDYRSFLRRDIKGIKVGIPKELMVKGMDNEVKESVLKAVSILEKNGAYIEETSLPSLEYALSVYYIVAASEASSNLSRFDGVRYGFRDFDSQTLREMYKKTRAQGFGSEVKRRIMIGTFCLSSGYYDAYYEKAQKVRTLIINDFKNAFSKYDVLASPTSPTPAFNLGEKTDDPLLMHLSDICTSPVNLAGIPAISIPAVFQVKILRRLEFR